MRISSSPTRLGPVLHELLPHHPLDTFGGLRTNLRRSATEAQLGLVIEFASEIELLFESRFELKFEVAFDSEFRFEFEI